jgi:hypothetical protein
VAKHLHGSNPCSRTKVKMTPYPIIELPTLVNCFKIVEKHMYCVLSLWDIGFTQAFGGFGKNFFLCKDLKQ